MGKMIEWFKAHPLAAGLIVFGVGLILVLSLFGGSSNSQESAVATAAPSDVGANSALVAAQLNASVQIAAAQLNANVQTAAISASQAMNKDNNDAAITGLTIQSDTSKTIATLQAANDAAAIQATKDINATQASAAERIAGIQYGASTTIAGLMADSQNKQTDAAVTIAGLNNQLGNVQANYNYQLGSQQIAANLNAQNTQALYNFQNTNNALNVQYGLGIHAIDVASAVAQATGQPYSVQGGR